MFPLQNVCSGRTIRPEEVGFTALLWKGLGLVEEEGVRC